VTASRLGLLHGFALDARVWRPQLAEFPDAVAPDVPGFGARQLEGAADLSLLERVFDEAGATVLMGHSLGAAVAIELALRRPSRFAQLVLTNPLLLGRSGRIPSWPVCIERTRAGDLDGARTAWLADPLFAEMPAPLAAEVGEIVRGYGGGHWRGTTTTAFTVDNPAARLAELTLPVLVVSAARDLEGFRAMAEEYARLLPRARLEVMDAGHMAPYEAPERFNALVRRFLDRPEAP
jgi:pimeloyl-ACP methyl ester carboxylesterase